MSPIDSGDLADLSLEEEASTMLKGENTEIRRISARLSEQEAELAKAYIQGAVHSFCKNNPGQEFSGRILFGGENGDWHYTPLQRIYEWHCETGVSDPRKQAAIDVGWLLKAVLNADERTFVQTVKDTGWRYQQVL